MPGDLRRAFRSLARRRTFAVIAVLTLALAFSMPAVVLSTMDRHFWRPLDLPEPDRLFTLQIQSEDGYFGQLRSSDHLPLVREKGADAFSLAAFESLDFTMVAGGAPARVDSRTSRTSASRWSTASTSSRCPRATRRGGARRAAHHQGGGRAPHADRRQDREPGGPRQPRRDHRGGRRRQWWRAATSASRLRRDAALRESAGPAPRRTPRGRRQGRAPCARPPGPRSSRRPGGAGAGATARRRPRSPRTR